MTTRCGSDVACGHHCAKEINNLLVIQIKSVITHLLFIFLIVIIIINRHITCTMHAHFYVQSFLHGTVLMLLY